MISRLMLQPRRSLLALMAAPFLALAMLLWAAVPAGATAVTTELVSVSSTGQQGNSDSAPGSISPDGRFVGFDSLASNLVEQDTNGVGDAFRHDRLTGQTIRVSVSSAGVEGNDVSGDTAISGDSDLVAFDSLASNLVPGDTNGTFDAFVHNLTTGETTRVSVSSSGQEGQADSGIPSLSDDGRLVVFTSAASLAPEDTNGTFDTYVHDLATGDTSLVSVSSTGDVGNGDSLGWNLSHDDRFVVFESNASDLVPGDTNGTFDVFLRDLVTGQTTRVSLSSSGSQGDGDSFSPRISADGRFVAFSSASDNLVSGDKNGFIDLFVRDLKTGKTTLVSKSTNGRQGNAETASSKGISADGRFVAYRSFASNLVPGDTNGAADAFLTDRQTGRTIRASLSATGKQGDYESYNVGLSQDARWVVFGSFATNFVPGGDMNGLYNGDTYVRGPLGAGGSGGSNVTPRAASGDGALRPSERLDHCSIPTLRLRWLARLLLSIEGGCT